MKKVMVILLCAAMAVALAACSGGGSDKPEDQIVGKWEQVNNEGVSLDFKSDGSVDVAAGGEIVETMTYEVNGDQLTFFSGDEETGTMTIDGNELKDSNGTVTARKQ